MNGNLTPFPIKSQMTEISFQGRTYKVCSEGQMNYILAVGLQEIQMKAASENKQLSEQELKEELKKYKENCGYGLIDEILAKVSPEERERWKMNYRYAGIVKRSSKE